MTFAAILLVVVLAACGDKKQPAGEAPPTITCNAVGEVVAKNWAERGKRAKSDFERDQAAKMGPIAGKRLVDHCVDDKWSMDGLTCVIAELERKGREELEQAEGKHDGKPPPPDQIEKCLTEAQVRNLLGTAPPQQAPRFPAPGSATK